MIFQNRSHAGVKLAKMLKKFAFDAETVVVGVAGGGVIVAAPIAKALGLPLETVIAEKLYSPGNPELGIGAVTSEGVSVYNLDLITLLNVSKEYVKKETLRQQEKASWQMQLFTEGRLLVDLKGKRVILVDEGIATGATIRAAINALRDKGAAKIIVAVPVGAPVSIDRVLEEADEWYCLIKPVLFQSIGVFYKNFEPVENEEVLAILNQNELCFQ